MKLFLRFNTLLLIITLSSCENKTEKENFNHFDDLVIYTGFECGWCAGYDSVRISKETTTYTNTNYCYESEYKASSITNRNDWNELLQLVNLEEFTAIDINTCDLCADGCDTWVEINYDTISHRIRFGYRDSMIVNTVQPLIDKLNEIRSAYYLIYPMD